jgi:hypothetical protein
MHSRASGRKKGRRVCTHALSLSLSLPILNTTPPHAVAVAQSVPTIDKEARKGPAKGKHPDTGHCLDLFSRTAVATTTVLFFGAPT